jgi:hypothetical protein
MRRALAFALVTTAGALAHAQNVQYSAGRVHIDGSPDVELEAYDYSYEWHPVCAAPCDRRVPLAFGYRIAGPDVQPSKPFALSLQGDAHLTVEAGSHGLHTAGLILTPTGSSAIGIGLVFLLIGAVTYSCSDCINGFADTTLLNWGWALIGGGTAGLIGGIVMLTSSHTDVSLWGEPVHYVRMRDLAFGRERPYAPQPFTTPLFAVSF